MQKIKLKVSEFSTHQGVFFNDGTSIHDDHYSSKRSYADFNYLENSDIKEKEFTLPLLFEIVPNEGFRFGNEGNMYFVPCYLDPSDSNENTVDIIYNGEYVLHDIKCKRRE